MPYKVIGTTVYVKKGGQWVKVKKHPNKARARKHAAALNIRVKR